MSSLGAAKTFWYISGVRKLCLVATILVLKFLNRNRRHFRLRYVRGNYWGSSVRSGTGLGQDIKLGAGAPVPPVGSNVPGISYRISKTTINARTNRGLNYVLMLSLGNDLTDSFVRGRVRS